MGFFKPDLIDIISKVPDVDMTDDIKNRLKTALADKQIANDMEVILTAAIVPFQKAAGNPATDATLRSVFNDVASVLPLAAKSIKIEYVPKMEIPKLVPTFVRLAKNGDDLVKAYNKPDPAITTIFDTLLANDEVQKALGRILTNPKGKDLFALEQDADGKGYAVERLSGTNLKFPLTKENYDTITRIVAAANANSKPQPPKFGT